MAESAVRTYAADKHFAAATLERWLALPAADRDALLDLAARLRLGENQFRDVLDDLTAIAARRTVGLVDVLADAEVAAALAAAHGRNETVKVLKLTLRRLRYPQLNAAEQRLRDLGRGLRLPKGVAITVPENLEGDAIAVTLRGRSAAELRAQARAVVTALDGPDLEAMFAVLEGRW